MNYEELHEDSILEKVNLFNTPLEIKEEENSFLFNSLIFGDEDEEHDIIDE